MIVPWVFFDERPYIDVMGLEVALRDFVATCEREGASEEADGVRRVIAILEAVTRRERNVIA